MCRFLSQPNKPRKIEKERSGKHPFLSYICAHTYMHTCIYTNIGTYNHKYVWFLMNRDMYVDTYKEDSVELAIVLMYPVILGTSLHSPSTSLK